MVRYAPHMLLALTLAASLGLSGCATAPNDPTGQNQIAREKRVTGTYNENELVSAISGHLGVTAESGASVIERMFRKQGRPVGYIVGQEGGGAFIAGLRYGKGKLWMKDGRSAVVYWQGPSIGFDWGADGSKAFVLVYGLEDPKDLYRRFPGVNGSAFLVGGMAVNYQRADGITLAPIRTGVGARLGANIGYLSYSRKRKILPF
ncbi:MAG: hypothetical protein COA43_02225 [Robiginitomaculum sp.]|nr:MAG: hypothetical protein COA43_02225 [Robiginitomaculum sp.]